MNESPVSQISISATSICLLFLLVYNQKHYFQAFYTRFTHKQSHFSTTHISRELQDNELTRDNILSDTHKQEQFEWSSELPGWTLVASKQQPKKNYHVNVPRRGQRRRRRRNDELTLASSSRCLWPHELENENEIEIENENENEKEKEKEKEKVKVCEGRKIDRVIDQLLLQTQTNKSFKIVPSIGDYYPIGEEMFLTEGCLVNKCQITYNKEEADAIIFQNSDVHSKELAKSNRRKDQIWIAYLLESPLNTFDRKFTRPYRGQYEFNWTATYRDDSDIITPYSMFVPYKEQVNQFKALKLLSNISEINRRQLYGKLALKRASELHKNFIAKKKPAKVAWFASNCNAANNRLEYARQLSRFIQVDIYGRCGNFTCDKWNQTGCAELINKDYKFYLSFENSNCRNYITEKLFKNAYGNNDLDYLVLPIVMGAPKSDYEQLAPPASFIHVDDFTGPQELANYLKLLDKDDALYYSYFQWKTIGRFIDTKFMCRVCAMLHHSFHHKVKINYSKNDLKTWWNLYNSKDACSSM